MPHKKQNKLSNVSLEDICKKASIESHIIELETDDREHLKKKLHSLATIAKIGKRNDAVIVLAGYFSLKAKTMDDIEHFLKATWPAESADLTALVLERLCADKNAYRRKLIMDELLKQIERILWKQPDQRSQFEEIIESSVWGRKMKDKFLSKIWENINHQA